MQKLYRYCQYCLTQLTTSKWLDTVPGTWCKAELAPKKPAIHVATPYRNRIVEDFKTNLTSSDFCNDTVNFFLFNSLNFFISTISRFTTKNFAKFLNEIHPNFECNINHYCTYNTADQKQNTIQLLLLTKTKYLYQSAWCYCNVRYKFSNFTFKF